MSFFSSVLSDTDLLSAGNTDDPALFVDISGRVPFVIGSIVGSPFRVFPAVPRRPLGGGLVFFGDVCVRSVCVEGNLVHVVNGRKTGRIRQAGRGLVWFGRVKAVGRLVSEERWAVTSVFGWLRRIKGHLGGLKVAWGKGATLRALRGPCV